MRCWRHCRARATAASRSWSRTMARGPATAALVERWRPRLGVPLRHVWQENCGFRAAEIRNRAILACRGDYCVFLDGDCIARPDFIATHRRLAEPGWFVTGNRVLLSPALTDAVLRDGLAARKRGALPLAGAPQAWRRQPACGACCGCRSDPCASSGRDIGGARAPAISRSGAPISIGSTASTPAFSGWGREDSDLLIRLLHCGRAPQGRALCHRRHSPVASRGRPCATGRQRRAARCGAAQRPHARATRPIGAARHGR